MSSIAHYRLTIRRDWARPHPAWVDAERAVAHTVDRTDEGGIPGSYPDRGERREVRTWAPKRQDFPSGH